jgi:hypothetical protein
MTSDQLGLKLCIKQMIPWVAYAASAHPTARSFAQRVISRSMAALKLAGDSTEEDWQRECQRIEKLEASELDQVTEQNERMAEALADFRTIGSAMLSCRSGSGEDDSRLYDRLNQLVNSSASAGTERYAAFRDNVEAFFAEHPEIRRVFDSWLLDRLAGWLTNAGLTKTHTKTDGERIEEMWEIAKSAREGAGRRR